MRLDSITIKNFRGYVTEQTLHVSDLTTVVGKNDVGKSTILEALAIFFGDDVVKPEVADLSVTATEREFEITCSFSELPESVVLDAQAETSLAGEYLLTEQGRLSIRKRYICTGVKPKEEVFLLCHHPSTAKRSDLLLLTNAALKTRLAELLSAEDAAAVNKSSNPAMRRAIWAHGGDLSLTSTEIPVKEDSKKIWERLAPLLPHFALFQSDRASRDSDSEVQDPMKLAIAAALADPEVQTMLDSVVEAVRTRATDLASRTHEVLGELDPTLADGLVPTFKSDPRWSTLFGVALEGTDGVPINKRGSGVRRLVLVSFFRAEAQRQTDAGSTRNVIYAIEEPETSQHPRNQKILLDSFEKMASNPGCQVLITTHSPGIAGHVSAESLRFVSKRGGNGPEIAAPDDEYWAAIAEELGVLPDDRVRVLICVEGPNDVTALKALSKALSEGGLDVMDLSADERVAFVPMGGGSLQQWVAERYLRGFGRPEFHLYDNDVETYQAAIESVNARTDGSRGRMTKRREMENYLHPKVIEDVFRLSIEFGPDDDLPKMISDRLKGDGTLRSLNVKNVKAWIAERAFPLMTKETIGLADPDGEVVSWFRDIEEVISATRSPASTAPHTASAAG